MRPSGAHILLTYRCDRQCEHCFLYCAPSARGTFTLEQLRAVLRQLVGVGTIERVYFEGGEPFLFYPLLLEGTRLARGLGFEVGIVTNGYWARSVEDALHWLRPLAELGLADLSVSHDAIHDLGEEVDPAANALEAARQLDIPCLAISIERPTVVSERGEDRGEPIVGGDVVFRGRAVDRLTGDLPRRPAGSFGACLDEELRAPARLHLDAHGHVHVCQGVSLGNLWRTPLAELVARYDPEAHPIVGPLLRGGPAGLAREHGVAHEPEMVSACHLCFEVRRALRPRFPDLLAPEQVYGPAAGDPG